jgi:hypothetical protein
MANEVGKPATSTALQDYHKQGEPPTAKAARALVRRLDKMAQAPLEKQVHSLIERGKLEALVFSDNLLYGLYMAQRDANEEKGRPDTPAAMVGPDKHARTNLGNDLVARQGMALGDTPVTKVVTLKILLHPKESEGLLKSFEDGLKTCMLELKRQQKWEFTPLEFKVIGRGDGRMSKGAHDPTELAEVQAFNKVRYEVLVAEGLIKPKAIAAPKQQ